MTDAYVRVYAEYENTKRRTPVRKPFRWPSRILVFDTETTTDHYQNLTIGFYHIYNLLAGEYTLSERGCFYDSEQVSENDMSIVKDYCRAHTVSTHPVREFVDKIFYPEVYEAETWCVGFNLFFDLPRIALRTGYGRRWNRRAFTLKLSENPDNTQVRITRVDGKLTFYGFASNRKNPGFKGNFLDLATFGAVLHGSPLSLKNACQEYNKTHYKQPDPKHGKITKKYLEYGEGDVYCTAELCFQLFERYEEFRLDLCPTKVYSEASLGKQALREWNITPFNTHNPDFSRKHLGYLMSAYAGARTECKLRCTPQKIDYTDFKSMYPSLFILMDLQKILLAEKIISKHITPEQIRKRIKKITVLGFLNPKAWKDNLILVKLIPQQDVFPIRICYNPKSHLPTLGLNHVTSEKPMWFALQDVLASMLITGKTPHILEGIQFTPQGQQDNLQLAEILGERINPQTENIVKRLIEKREEYKETTTVNARQKQLKILVNAMCYGIYIQFDPQHTKETLHIYSRKQFTTQGTHEQAGEFYNPIISVFQVAGARLLLAMGETKLKTWGTSHVYMDTDSILVPTGYGQRLSEYFQPLNPYDFNKPFLEVELENATFLGISSKRYALFDKKRNPIEKHYKLHGLGHLRPPFKAKNDHWHKEVWTDLLQLHTHKITEADIYEKYSGAYAISKITISTPEIHKRFKKLNEGKSYSEQIKPGGFLLVGQGTDENIKPVCPFSANTQTVAHESFINYTNCKELKGTHHWKSLAETMTDYAHHKENKFENGDEKGMMQRQHLKITGFKYIGKEAKELDTEPLGAAAPSEYETRAMKTKRITSMTVAERKKHGISRQKKHYWKQKL